MRTCYLDIETTGLNPFEDHVVTCQILCNGVTRIFRDREIAGLKLLLERSLVIGHNISFDLKFLKHHYGISPKSVYCTRVAEIAISGGLYAEQRGTALKDLTRRYLSLNLDKTEQTGFRMGEELREKQIQYAAMDVMVLPEIYKAQQAQIRELDLQGIISIEMECLPGVVWLELSGMPIDMDKLATLHEKTVAEQQKAVQDIQGIVRKHNKGYQQTLTGSGLLEVNLKSPQKLKELLNDMGIPCTGTSDKELQKFKHPILAPLLEYRRTTKLLDTYLNKYPELIRKDSCRIHASFNQYGARSGRFTCKGPNLQQQPNNQEWRSIYTAPKGYKIVTADYSQIELRILGELSGDAAFIKAYRDGLDLHRLTASHIFKKSPEDVTKQERQIAKKINFGVIYGQGSGGLMEGLQQERIVVTKQEATKYIEGFYAAYPSVAEYMGAVSYLGTYQWYLKRKGGRLFKFVETGSSTEVHHIQRQCRNLPIQGLCADMIKKAICNLQEILEPWGVKFINCVHDELVFECTEDMAGEVAAIVKQEMEYSGSTYLKQVPCIAEVSIADTWSK